MSFMPALPTGWRVRRLKYVATCNDDVLPESTDEFAELRYVEISGVSLVGGIENTSDVYFHEAPSRARRRVKSGDILISTVRTYLKAIAAVPRAEFNLIASTGFCVVRPGSGVDSGYLGWVAKSEPFVAEIVTRSTGVSYPAIKPSELATLGVPLPPLETQRSIARLLDAKTAQIDALIAKKRALLERLAEKRQALITQAVTKGLDPGAPMKDSGIDWFGNVPEGWIRVPLKRVIVLQRGHDLPESQREDGVYPVVSSAGYSGTHDVAVARAPGIVTGRYGSIGRFTYVDQDYWPLNTALYSIELYDNDARFVWYLLQHLSALFVLNSMKSAVPGVDRNDVHRNIVCVPSVAEQGMVTAFLDHETARIDELAERIGRSVALLVEYREALITAAVTGQLEIPADRPHNRSDKCLGKLATEVA